MSGTTLNDRKLASNVRTLTLREIEKILKREDMDELKKQVILRLAPTVLPRLTEVTGEGGGPLQLNFDKRLEKL